MSKQGATGEPPEPGPDVRTIMLSVGAGGTVCGARLKACVVVTVATLVVQWPHTESTKPSRTASGRGRQEHGGGADRGQVQRLRRHDAVLALFESAAVHRHDDAGADGR